MDVLPVLEGEGVCVGGRFGGGVDLHVVGWFVGEVYQSIESFGK